MVTVTADAPTCGGGDQGIDIEIPVGTAPTISGGGSSVSSDRKKNWALVSAFLFLVFVVAVSLGVTLGGGDDDKSTTATAMHSRSTTDTAGKPIVRIE